MKLTIITDGHRSRMCFLTERFACGRSAIVSLLVACTMFISITGLSIAHDPEPIDPTALGAFHGKVFKTVIVPDYYPYSFVNENGLPDGFSVDIAQAVAKVMGLKIEIGVNTWENAKRALEDGSIDFLPMMAYSSERHKSFDFSVPHTIAYDGVFVRKGMPKVATLDDLAGKTIIIMNKDAAHDYFLSSGMSDKINLILVDSISDGLQLLSSGKGDVLLMPKLVGLILMRKLNVTNVEESPLIIETYSRPFGFAVKKGNTALVERLGQGLRIIKDNGRYDDIYRKWFGALEPVGLSWKTVLKYAAVIAGIFSLIGMFLLFWSVSLQKKVVQRTRSLEAEIVERKKTENALRDSEERFRMAMEAAEEGLWDWDITSGHVYYSPGWGRILGYSPEEMEPRYEFWESKIHTEDKSATLRELNDHISGRKHSFEAEHRLRGNDGEWIWVLGKGKVVATDTHGSVLRLVGTMTDISERKRIEKDIQSTLSRFYTILSSLYSGVLLVTKDGVVEFANQAFCDLFDLDDPPGKLHGLNAPEVIGKIKGVYANPDEALARITKIVSQNLPVKSEEIAIVGGRTYIRDFIPILVDGKPYGRFWQHSDITGIKRAAEALMESEERFRLAVATSPDAISITRLRDGLFVEINDAFTELSGYTRNDVSNKTSNQINVWKNPEDREKIVELLMEKGSCANQEAVFQRKDGSLFSGSMSASVMSHKGDLHIISMTRDITDRLQAEQEKQNLQAQLFQAQKLEALGTLVGGIAHDFNNMLQIMLGYSQFLLDDKKIGESGYKELQTIIETGKGGADLVKKLLAFGQQGQALPVPLDLNHQISQLSTLISHTLPHVVQVDLDLTDKPTTIRADHGQIDQVVMNLAINASEAMPNGGRLQIATTNVSLDDDYCSTHHGVQPGPYVMLSVSDTGRGMNKRTLAKIFDPFFSTKERGSTRGTGLGLSVVKGIVQQQGGQVTCESEPGKGTTFKVYFPAIEAPVISLKTVAPTVQSVGMETILVVEDNIPVAEFERKVLANAGYTVIVANNGREAFDVYQKQKEEISLVILDLLMPEMSGRDCLMELLKIDPSVKVLIASGYSPEDELHNEISPLVKGFVHKPFGIAQLLNEARCVLDGG